MNEELSVFSQRCAKTISDLYNRGYWSLGMFLTLQLVSTSRTVFISMSPMFVAYKPTVLCSPSLNASSPVCNKSVCAIAPHRSDIMKSSIAHSFSLICQDDYWVSLSQSILLFGIFCGGTFIVPLSDRYGRKTVVTVSNISSGLIGIAQVMSPNIYVFSAFNFLLGMCRQVTHSVSAIWALEFLPETHFVRCSIFCGFLWSGCYMCTLLMGYILTDWVHLQLVGSLLTLVMCLSYTVVPQSPRWLMNQGNFDVLETDILVRCEKWNSHKLNKKLIIEGLIEARLQNQTEKESQFSWAFLKYRKFVFWLLILVMTESYCSIGYYSLSFIAIQLPGNQIFNALVVAICEVPACLFAFMVFSIFKRQIVMFSTMFFGGLVLVVIAYVSVSVVVQIAVFVFVKLTILTGIVATFITPSVLYPSNVRSSTVSIVLGIGSLMNCVFPFLANKDHIDLVLCYLIIGVFGMAVGALNVFIPSRLNKPFPETVNDSLSFTIFSRRKRTAANHNRSNGVFINFETKA